MSDDAPEADYYQSSVDLFKDTLKQAPDPPSSCLQGNFPPDSIIAGKYRVLSLLGRGGMGVVYKVEQIFLQEIYALKAIQGGTSDFAWRRFQLEAKALARLNHQSIIGLKDFGLIVEDSPYFVTDFAEGKTLAAILKESGALSVEDALADFIQIAQALAHAHSVGVIHRDIKPSNIVIRDVGDGSNRSEVKILDFGIAKIATDSGQSLTATGEIFGSPYYMSPEQCSGVAVDERSDIYSFGCVLFEALTGAPPFIGESPLATLMKHQNEDPPRLKEASFGRSFSSGIENVAARLLAKDVMERYQSFDEVLVDLLQLQSVPDSKNVALNRSLKKSSKMGVPSKIKLALIGPFALGLAFVSVIAILVLNPESKELQRNAPGDQAESGAGPDEQDSDGPFFHRAFSEVEHKPGEHAFEFPPSISLGTLKDLRTGEKKQARGRVIFPAGHRLRLEPNLSLMGKPRYLSRFQSSDLQSLSFKHLLPEDKEGAKVAQQDNVNDGEMQFIKNLTELEELDLGDTNITDDGLSCLKGLSRLEALNISYTRCTARGVTALPCFMSLKELVANGVIGNGKLPMYLERSKSIERLHLLNDVLGGGMTDEDLRPFEKLASVRDLSLACNSKITDSGLRHLKNLENLEKLNLMGCSITPGCCQYLGSLQRLRELKIDFDPNNGWTDAAVEKLRQSLPNGCQLHPVEKSNAWQPIGRRFGELLR